MRDGISRTATKTVHPRPKSTCPALLLLSGIVLLDAVLLLWPEMPEAGELLRRAAPVLR